MRCCGLFGIILLVVCSFNVAVTGFPFKNGNSQYVNRMCEFIDEVTNNSTCKDGVYRNLCGKLACLSGVGGDCDEHRATFRYGKCADGLLCNCEKCQGCLRGECYANLLCFKKFPFIKRMNTHPIEYPINYNEY